MIQLEQIHHVAYRCRDAKETVAWYQDKLNMEFLVAIAEDRVPSTKAPDPYMHLFLDAGNGNILAFFELPNSPEMGRDPNTPEWVQHIAFRVADEAALMAAKAELESKGVEVVGPTEHGIIRSIYFFDPNGHRLELTYVKGTDEQMRRLKEVAPAMIEEWSKTKRAPKHAAWLHEEEFNGLD
ncbi:MULTISPECIES: VOC family protein [Halomonas]|uniref:VOC family protein n=1 Tax=Halomonas TaxID=2745 RepID=UPI000E5A6105|nr:MULTISPECIES: VOC family protein [Halomonas]AXY42814.1 VOC family protein [Halomonas sp. JS92-SW72]